MKNKKQKELYLKIGEPLWFLGKDPQRAQAVSQILEVVNQHMRDEVSHLTLDISTIPVEHVALAWLAPLCAVNKPKKLLISEQQADALFSGFITGGRNATISRWTHYRDIELTVII